VLEPFKVMQQMFEGQQYVTLSLVPSCLALLRKELQKSVDNIDGVFSPAVVGLAKVLVLRFEAEFGDNHESRQRGDIFHDHQRGLVNRRVMGLSLVTLIACAVDPRTSRLKVITV
jgi:hypothetical protein